MQSPKTTNSNTCTQQPQDLTTYKYKLYFMWGQSFHSSVKAKRNSQKLLIQENYNSNMKDIKLLNLSKGSKSNNPIINRGLSVSLWTKNELNKYMSKNRKYNGIINILANLLFL